jgi:hypothetical protein
MKRILTLCAVLIGAQAAAQATFQPIGPLGFQQTSLASAATIPQYAAHVEYTGAGGGNLTLPLITTTGLESVIIIDNPSSGTLTLNTQSSQGTNGTATTSVTVPANSIAVAQSYIGASSTPYWGVITQGSSLPAIANQTVLGNGSGSTAAAVALTLSTNLVATSTGLATSQPINPQTGTSYAMATTDAGKLVTFSNASAIAVSLSQATTTGFTAGYSFDVENLGAGLVTITPATSTINGKTTLVIPTNNGCTISSDGTNYQVSACTAVDQAGPVYTVSTLPTCNSGTKYQTAVVTDASSPTYNGTLTGSSSTIVPVFCNGTAWTAH